MKKIIPLTLLIITAVSIPAMAETMAKIPKFTVELVLTEAASAKLKETGDKPQIDIYYQGTPLAGDKTSVNDEGQIELGEDSTVLFQPGPAEFGGTEFDASLLDHIEGKEAHVLINVNSSKFDKNVIDCDVFEDKVSEAAKAPVRLNCDVAAN